MKIFSAQPRERNIYEIFIYILPRIYEIFIYIVEGDFGAEGAEKILDISKRFPTFSSSHLEDLILKVVGFTKKIEKNLSQNAKKNLGAFGAKRG